MYVASIFVQKFTAQRVQLFEKLGASFKAEQITHKSNYNILS